MSLIRSLKLLKRKRRKNKKRKTKLRTLPVRVLDFSVTRESCDKLRMSVVYQYILNVSRLSSGYRELVNERFKIST